MAVIFLKMSLMRLLFFSFCFDYESGVWWDQCRLLLESTVWLLYFLECL